MATRDELITGYEFLIGEAHRIAADLKPEQWAHAVDPDGWKGLEVLAHVAGIGGVVAPMVGMLLNAPAGASPVNLATIDPLNASLVAARAGKTPAELAEEIAQGYGAAIEWVQSAPQETLERRVTAGGHRDVALSDALMRMTVLHGIAHIYTVYGALFYAEADGA